MDVGDFNKKINQAYPVQRINAILTIVILVLPFVLFLWMLPFVSDWTLGKDYQRFSIEHQMELMFSLKTESFPLYVPGFAGGQSASALTLGQIFHPISHLASIMPGYWEGKALEWNTLLRIIFLGLAHWALFSLLLKLDLKSIMAFVLSMVTVYNLRMLDLFRYGAALESWSGHLFLCAAIGWYYLKPTIIRGPISIIFATYWLICSGHPQMIYYGFLGAGLFTLIWPHFVAVMLPDRMVDLRATSKFWLRTALYCLLGLLLSSAYLLPFYFDFVQTNAERVGQAYAWADLYRDTLMGTINNFFHPLRSDVIGAFGGSSLFLLAALIPVLKLTRVRIPYVIWAIWGIALVAFLHMQGGRTPVHYLFWKFFPFASSFRGAGRISLILPVLFMLLLSWLVRSELMPLESRSRSAKASSGLTFPIIALIIFTGYSFIPGAITSDSTSFSPARIREISAGVELTFLLSGMAVIAVVGFQKFFPRKSYLGEILVLLFVCIQLLTILPNGTWVEKKKPTPSLAHMLSAKKIRLDYIPLPGAGMTSAVVERQVQRSFLEPFIGKIYTRFRIAGNNEEAYYLLEQGRTADEVVVEKYATESDSFNKKQQSKVIPERVELAYSSFNRLVFNVQASGSSFFGLAYPNTGHWVASVNGRDVRIYRANGAAHAVQIPAGKSRVEFRYRSLAAVWGMILSCTTLVLIGIFYGLVVLKRSIGYCVAIAAIIIGVAGFSIWYLSLYTGDNFGNKYVWQKGSPKQMLNLAYGRPTNMSSYLYKNQHYLIMSNRAVDGNRAARSGFQTGLQLDPWWMVDLRDRKSIEAIHIYESQFDSQWNKRPLSVSLSSDGKNWRKVKTLEGVKSESPIEVKFEESQMSRYVLIHASGTCFLSFDEVEIYPSSKQAD